jgi:hypothetical protein
MAERVQTIKAAGYWAVLVGVSIAVTFGLHLVDTAIQLAAHR